LIRSVSTVSEPLLAPPGETPTDPLAHIAGALFRPMGVDGVYARTALYELVAGGLERYITGQRDPQAEILRFPPVMSRQQLEKSGYLRNFPNLLGCVCALRGSEAAIHAVVDRHGAGEDWTGSLTASDLVLSPAACYPVYPMVAERGRIPSGGLLFDVEADVFRHEPSRNLDRLQSFRMREFVRIGSPQEIQDFREGWMTRASALAAELGLPSSLEVASDPFFGRVGQVIAVSQRQQALKFELLIPYRTGATPTACMSFNDHREHFSQLWVIHDERGRLAHTGCVAFGIDRLAVALFAVHGLDLEKWPASTRLALAM
jgi:seryl-tRNA synthetase